MAHVQHTREAVQVDGPQQIEELDTVLREVREVLVDHVQRAFKDVLHDDRNLVFHQILEPVLAAGKWSQVRIYYSPKVS